MKYLKSLIMVLKAKEISLKIKMLVILEFIINTPKYLIMLIIELIYIILEGIYFIFDKLLDCTGSIFCKLNNTRDWRVIRNEETRRDIIDKIMRTSKEVM